MKTIEIDGFNFRYQSEGSGPDCLVIGSAQYYVRSFSEGLRRALRLHFVDYRGFAEPPVTGIDNIPTLETMLDDLAMIQKQLSLDKCIVMGHSAHALLALEYAKRYPENISKIVMICVSPNFSAHYATLAHRNWEESVWPERKAELEKRIKEFPDEKLAQLPAGERFIRWNARRAPQIWYDYHTDPMHLWEGVFPNMSILDYVYGVALRDIDVTQGLEKCIKPVLLISGRYDYIIAPISCWDPLRPKFKDLTVKIFERSGHSPQYEEPALFQEELLKWL